VIDYGAGNLVSIGHALERVGASVSVARRPAELRRAEGLVVPGVGSSGPAMAALRARALVDPILAAVDRGVPYLGICLGLELLFERSEEDAAEGLGVIRGNVRRLSAAPRLPHIGWNQVERRRDHPLFGGIGDGAACYFVHSYAGVPDDPSVVLAETEHGGRFVSAVASGPTLGVQFHPERSGEDGLRLLANYVDLVRAGR
ncbi:MAG: imidazole glycerol phosphate synthase subunit HisH, partial [Chloroflexota bacterium]|nr:imidazole glycerol phosphate synthase subunit HisH [Chloroflexota bacterium]